MKNYKQGKGDLGQHWTPDNIVEQMINLIQNKNSKVLEPSAGSGKFLKKLKDCIGIEIDESVIDNDLKDKYIIDNFFNYSTENKFDTIIGNPPYVQGRLLDFEIPINKVNLPKTANLYLHFINKCLYHLTDVGELIFIIPQTFLNDLSLGKDLRNRMLEEGSFTDVIFLKDSVWEKATIETIIIRFQKNIFTNLVKINSNENKILINSKGFYFLMDEIPSKFIRDYFKVSVGSQPFKKEIFENLKGDYTYKGNLIFVDETNKDKWHKIKNTIVKNKIFFNKLPTRKFPIFYSGSSEKHIDNVLIPFKEIDDNKIKELSILLNKYFKEFGTSLGFIKGGRWMVGIKQIENCPLSKDLIDFLENC